MPADVAAAPPFQPASLQGAGHEFNTDEDWADSWWPF
jgi:hypothetical protein